MNIRRFGAAVICASTCSVIAAPVAYADENMYLQQIRQPNKLFISVTNGQLLQLGYTACQAMRVSINNGKSMARARSQADKAVAQAAYAMGLQSDLASNMNITEEAENNLC